MKAHDQELAAAFDGQAEQFERSPVQSDPEALARLVRVADLPPDSLVLDVGCGPGLVAEAFLRAGYRVLGVDLSRVMLERARLRCAAFAGRAEFRQGSLFDLTCDAPCDASVSRHVLHHVADPRAFVGRQAVLVRAGGTIVIADHTTDPDPAQAGWHQEIERARDRTHTTCFSPGAIVDLLATCGLTDIQAVEESFVLDFDEWFDRGTPGQPKAEVRAMMTSGGKARGFEPFDAGAGRLGMNCWRSIVRGRVGHC
jgi:SAM-dependent methyltransferase